MTAGRGLGKIDGHDRVHSGPAVVKPHEQNLRAPGATQSGRSTPECKACPVAVVVAI